jgi:hypothetical protein
MYFTIFLYCTRIPARDSYSCFLIDWKHHVFRGIEAISSQFWDAFTTQKNKSEIMRDLEGRERGMNDGSGHIVPNSKPW